MPTHAQQQNASQQATSPKSTQPATTDIGQLGFEAAEILNLQQSVGNHAVQRMLDTSSNGLAINHAAGPAIFRAPGDEDSEEAEEEEATPVPLTGLTVNHDRVTAPPEAGLSFSAVKTPSDATDVTLTLTGDSAAIAAGTSIDNDTGAITVGADQTGGSAQVEAEQTVPREDGGTNVISANAPFSFTGVPAGISNTSSGASGSYGGQFTHTFGGGSALELSHVNEQFPAAGGTTLNLTGPIGDLEVHVNSPDSASAGWDLDSSGTMAGPDNVTWSDGFSARPFIASASNPTPANTLPQALTATQNFRNLNYPSRTYGGTVATTTHRRAFEERDGTIKAVTTAGGQEVVQDYVGPTVFRNATASPDTLEATAPSAEGEEAPAGATSQIAVEVVGQDQDAHYWIEGEAHGCSVNRTTGEFTAGSEAGSVIVHAGRTGNYDAVTITITAPPAEESTEESAEEQTPGAPQGGITSTLPMNI